jgi:hypothetical protein
MVFEDGLREGGWKGEEGEGDMGCIGATMPLNPDLAIIISPLGDCSHTSS